MKQPVDVKEYTVIDHQLIREAIVLPPWMENEEARKESMDDKEIESIRMDFKNIRKIDFLTGLDNLTKLQLDNNCIGKVENLGHLTNLTWLDLSFNNIESIENLDTLVNLTDLSLYSNKISDIKNMDQQTKLQCLSLGMNQIKTIESLSYLIRFRNLQMVTLAGNPVCKDGEYKNYVHAHFKHMKYLDYRLVDPLQISTAREAYQEQLLELEDQEHREDLEKVQAEKEAAEQKQLAEANVEGIDKFFDSLFENDSELNKFKAINELFTPMGDYREAVQEHVQDYKQYMLDQFKSKQKEIGEFEKAKSAFKRHTEQKSINLITKYELEKKKVFREVRMKEDIHGTEEEEEEALKLLKSLRTENENLRLELMSYELDLVDTLEAVITAFESKYGSLVDNVKKESAEFYTKLRMAEDDFHENVQAIAQAEIERFTANPEEYEENIELIEVKNILSEKEQFMAAIQGSHDFRVNKVDQKEDQVTSREVKEKEELEKNERRSEHERNRDRITEVVGLIARNNAEIDEVIRELDLQE